MQARKTIWSSGQKVIVPGIQTRFWDKEDAFQIYCANYLRKHHPAVKFHHSANERLGGKAGFLCRLKGQSKGFPDLLILGPLWALELKVGKNKPSPEQIDWLEHFAGLGFKTAVVYTLSEFCGVVGSD